MTRWRGVSRMERIETQMTGGRCDAAVEDTGALGGFGGVLGDVGLGQRAKLSLRRDSPPRQSLTAEPSLVQLFPRRPRPPVRAGRPGVPEACP